MAVDKQKQELNRAIWSAGKWDEVADYVAGVGPGLLEAVGVEVGMRVLDVGTGSGGSVAIPAAKLGADVVGSDISQVHFDAARARAERAGVEVEWVEADALELPFDDGSFDRVLSTFGHMFAPDHQQAASELVRVTKPGGVIGFCAWTPEGSIGRMFRLTASHMPPPPEGFQPPPMWGSEEHVRSLMEPHGVEPRFERRLNEFREESLDAYSERFENNFGPMVMARQALGDGWPALQEELEAFFESENEAEDGSVLIRGEYLQTLAERPA
ncbi:MAG: class I SAM-dependent methyltransferase [Actinomycetota bacterium]|nr:class I SAM-dependent methyltransferase [Actinomycetota bacterium]